MDERRSSIARLVRSAWPCAMRRRHRPRRRHHEPLAAPARHAAGVGHGAARRRARLGRRRSSWRSGVSRLGLGRRRARAARRRHRHPGDDGRRGRPRPARPPGSLAHRRAGRARRHPPPAAGRPAAHRRVPALPRAASASPGGRASARSARTPTAAAPETARRCACGGCSRRPAASTSSSARSPPPASTCCPPTCAPSWPRCRTGCRPSRATASPPCSRPSSVTTSTRSFAEFDWEPLAAASIGQTHRARLRTGEAVVVKVQRPGIEATMERDLAALALLADLAQRRTSFGRGVRSGEHARPVRRGAAGRARLPARGRRDDRDGRPPRRRRHGPRADAAPPPVHPPGPRAGALRGPDGVEPRAAGADDDAEAPIRRASLRRAATACCCRRSTRCMRLGFFHADPHPGNVFVLADGTLGLIDFGAVGRLDPIQQAAHRRHVPGPRPARRRACCATASSGSPSVGDAASTGRAGARAGPADGRARAARRHDRPRPDAGARRRAGATSACACRPTSCCCRGRSSRSTARCACCRRAISLMSSAMRDARVARPASAVVDRDRLVRDELLAMLPHLRRLPERVDRILTLTRPRRAADARP